MTLPRRVLPGDTCLVTRRCTQRQFLLKPSEAVREVFLFCLAHAAARYDVQVHACLVLSDHVLCAAAHKTCYVELGVMRSEAPVR